MRLPATVVALSALLLGAPPARADIYVWRDQYGVSHYTNDLANVPPEFRATAITVAKDWVRAEPPPPERLPVEQPTPQAEQPSSAVLTEDGGEVDYYAGYEAGIRAAGSAPATVIATSSAAPVVQLMTLEPPRDRLLPVFGPLLVERRDRKRDEERDDRKPPAHRSFAGAAGPPPLGAAGPSPYFPFGR